MGIHYCLSTVKSTVKVLSNASIKASNIYESHLAEFNSLDPNDPHFESKLESIPVIRPEQIMVDALIADTATLAILIQKYQLVNAGVPLNFEGVDMFSRVTYPHLVAKSNTHLASTPEEEEDAIIRTFMFKTSGATGLIPVMEQTIRNEEVREAEIFSTYRAIGCQSFTAFEIAVHRAVETVADRVWEMAVELGALEEEKIKEEIKKEEEIMIKEEEVDD